MTNKISKEEKSAKIKSPKTKLPEIIEKLKQSSKPENYQALF